MESGERKIMKVMRVIYFKIVEEGVFLGRIGNKKRIGKNGNDLERRRGRIRSGGVKRRK